MLSRWLQCSDEWRGEGRVGGLFKWLAFEPAASRPVLLLTMAARLMQWTERKKPKKTKGGTPACGYRAQRARHRGGRSALATFVADGTLCRVCLYAAALICSWRGRSAL